MRWQTRYLCRLLSIAVLGAVGACVLAWAPPAQGAAPKRKMAMILPGSIQDADFNTVGYLALQAIAKTHDMQVSQSESVAIADAERVSREYIGAGYEILAYHGGTYIPIMKKLAVAFPNVVFIQETSGRLPDTPGNVWILGRKFYRGFYALGATGALSTKTNKVGFIGGVATPDVITSLNAVYQAIKEHNPTAKLNLGLYGIVEAAKASAKPVLVTTFYTEKWDLAPKHMSVSLTTEFAKPYTEIVGRILKGEKTGYYEMSPGSGMSLSDVRNTSPEVAQKVKGIFQEVVAGKQIPEIGDKIVVPRD